MSQKSTEKSAPAQSQADDQAPRLPEALARLTEVIGQGNLDPESQPPTETPPAADPTGQDLASAIAAAADQLAWHKAVLDSLPFPVRVFDQSHRRTYLNRPAAELKPLQKLEEPPGLAEKPWGNHLRLQDEPAGSPAGPGPSFIWHQPESGRVYDGQRTPVRDLKGHDLGRLETLWDITEAVDNSERTRLILDAMPLAFSVWDDDFNHIDCNQAVVKLFDLPSQLDFLELFAKLSPEFQRDGRRSADLGKEHLIQALNEGSHRFDWVHRKLNGELIPCEVNLKRMAWRGRFLIVGFIRDLREIKRAQAERDHERQLLNRVMDSAPICFIITVGGLIKFITPFAHNFTGLRLGGHIIDLYRDESVWEELNEELSERGFVNWRPVEIKRTDGQDWAMLLNAYQTDYYGQRGVMNWFMDINELAHQAEALKLARDAAEGSTRAKSEFLANMSHEIRTPMNAILGLTHLTLQTELSETQREYLQKAEGAAKTLLRIINDILDFSKIEAGKLEMEHTDFNLNDVLQTVVDMNSSKASEKGLEYILQVPPDTPVALVGDQIRLTQILSNLSNNAVKFTAAGQVALKVSTVAEKPDQVTLKFEVQDTGIGLSAEQVRNLFQSFTQAEVSTTRRFGGTGLGLVIAKRLVEMMGGGIWVESAPDKGSTFTFTADFGVQAQDKRYVVRRKDFRGLTALAVDDNLVALEIMSDFLTTMGFTVMTASSGLAAVELIQDWSRQGRKFDLLIIDWKMPDLDGIETADKIHDIISAKDLPVIIMATAYNRDDVLGQARRSGIRNVMTKPLSPSTMLNMLVDIFGRGGLPDKVSKLNQAHEMAMVKEYSGARILLAEDNEVNQLVASRILRNAGLTVDIANNGLEAVRMVQENTYDLVLMDIQMPEMDGIEATRKIRALGPYNDLPIVAMTAHAMSGDRELSLQAGMNDHINKPINLQELFSTLARRLKKRPSYT